MSQLDQAKKEAKRLFNLAKINQVDNSKNHIELENLSKAKEVISIINGYKSWHEYEEILKRKDILFDKKDKTSVFKENKLIYENKKYYVQDLTFNNIKNPNVINTALVVEKEHKDVILGRTKEKRFFETIEKKWILNQYPLLITGITGSGATETLLSLTNQYINNNEGVIYFDGKGENILYSKIFSYAKEANRLNDLYVLNFLSNNKDSEKLISHSIDPINPMLGNDEYFEKFFGKLGIIIHDILKETHQDGMLLDITSLESILMLNNLIMWNRTKKFKTQEINKYLLEIGLSLRDDDEIDLEEALLNHSYHSHLAYETVKILKEYSQVFKLDCSINMEKIFLERKLLLISLNSLEKATENLTMLGKLIISQIRYIEQKYQNYNVHFQNIIIDDFHYFSDEIKNINFNITKNNYIFSTMGYRENNDIFNYVLNNAKTNLIMRTYDNIPIKIKLDLIENLKEFPKLKEKKRGGTFIQDFTLELRNLDIGEAYVLCKNNNKNTEDIINNDYEFYCNYIKCEYLPAKHIKKLWLVEHSTPIIYIKENI